MKIKKGLNYLQIEVILVVTPVTVLSNKQKMVAVNIQLEKKLFLG